MAFSPEGDMLASASEGETFRLSNVTTGHAVSTEKIRSNSFISRPSVLDSGLLAAGRNGGLRINVEHVKISNISTGDTRILSDHMDSVLCMAFLRSRSMVATASIDKTVRLWSVAMCSLLQTIPDYTDWVKRVAYLNDDLKNGIRIRRPYHSNFASKLFSS